jgi:hypothetical protein
MQCALFCLLFAMRMRPEQRFQSSAARLMLSMPRGELSPRCSHALFSWPGSDTSGCCSAPTPPPPTAARLLPTLPASGCGRRTQPSASSASSTAQRKRRRSASHCYANMRQRANPVLSRPAVIDRPFNDRGGGLQIGERPCCSRPSAGIALVGIRGRRGLVEKTQERRRLHTFLATCHMRE